MAKIDNLIEQVGDDALRAKLAAAVGDLRKRKKFGLVYEEHVPESVLLASHNGVRVGAQVMLRKEPANNTRYTIKNVDSDMVEIEAGEDSRVVAGDDLLVVKAFGDPVYPVLRAAGEPVLRGGDKPFHTVLNGENFHALQLLLFAYEGRVDCIYIDPPYNTGARDWKYNNDYVDDNDTYQHSKWLSFMEKRLRMAKRLLKPDGVLIVTIDEHEVHNLGVLLAQTFKDAYQQTVSIVITAKGVAKRGLARVEEYALFTYLGSASASDTADDYLTDDTKRRSRNPWASLLRRGTNAAPADRAGLVYPILVDPKTKKILGVGETVAERIAKGELTLAKANTWVPTRTAAEAWPIRSDGRLGTWQVNPKKLLELRDKGYVKLGKYNEERNNWSVNYLKSGPIKSVAAGDLVVSGYEWKGGPAILSYKDDEDSVHRAKTVWRRTAHDAGTYGSQLLADFLGSRKFDFPKSLYAVHDTLATVVGANPDALVLDFFAGSGTTLHAVAMLNASDEGSRRCILVTNNDVGSSDGAILNAEGFFVGDEAYEEQGIFRSVTQPRVRAALTGCRRDGSAVPGSYLPAYLDEYEYADGFEENAAFFDLVYEDPDLVEVGDKFDDVLPALWLAAGAVGNPGELAASDGWLISDTSPLAVLLDEDRFKDFAKAVRKAKHVTHVWLVTDSDSAFARMRGRLPDGLSVGMLYRDYLRNFRINTEATR